MSEFNTESGYSHRCAVLKVLCYIICLCILVCSFGSCNAKPEEKNTVGGSGINVNMPSPGARKVVALGDSIAAGYGLSDANDNYVNIFSANIGATLTNYAVSGYTTEDLINHISVLAGNNDKELKNANVFVISIGGNDLIHEKDLFISTIKNVYANSGEYFTDEVNNVYNAFEKNLATMIENLKKANPNALVIIQTLYNPVKKRGYYISVINAAKYIDKYIVRLNESIIKVCESYPNVAVFDVYDRMTSDENNFYDLKDKFDDHPTVYGHATLAKIYTEEFGKLLPESK